MINPNYLFKILKAAGVKIRFDLDKQSLVIITDDGEKSHTFTEIEKMVNGDK